MKNEQVHTEQGNAEQHSPTHAPKVGEQDYQDTASHVASRKESMHPIKSESNLDEREACEFCHRELMYVAGCITENYRELM